MGTRSGIMLPIPFDEAKFNAMPKPCIVQPKLEGDRLRAIPNEHGGINLRSSGDKERVSIPHIKAVLLEMKLPFETDGEVYVHGMPHEQIRSIVSRTKNQHPDYWKMEYHIYDAVTEDSQMDRIRKQINRLSSPSPIIQIVPSYPVWDMVELQYFYDKFLAQGYEGIIIRHPNRPYKRSQVQWMLKLKPRLSGEYKIVDILPLINKDGVEQDTMGAFILEDLDGNRFNVGTGPTADDRMRFWFAQESVLGRMCKIRFQALTETKGVPKMQSIDKEWLKEIRKELKK